MAVSTSKQERNLLAPIRPITGTVGQDDMTVHTLDDEGNPLCGATGRVLEWQRTANCSACLAK